MSRGYRKSVTDLDLAYGDDYEAEAPTRWDRQRFERARARSRGPQAQDTVVVEEDPYDRRRDRQDVRIEIDDGRRAPRRRYQEPEPEPEQSPPRRRRPVYVEEERIEYGSREVAPYRPPPRRPARPVYQRRQSSLDTYDRRPRPRYGEDERDVNVSINVRPPPPEPKYRGNEYKYRDPDPYRDDVVIRREREREIIRTPEKVEESSDSFEEIEAPTRKKRGKTRMPKRLVHRSALIQLGLPFDEEEDFYMVRSALVKEQIDEVIKISETYFDDNKVIYKFQEAKLLEAPPPPVIIPVERFEPPEEPPPVVIETITTRIIENPTPEDYAAPSERGAPSVRGARSERGVSPGSERPMAPVGVERKVVAEITDSPPRVRRGRSKAAKARSRREAESSSSSSDETALVVIPSRRKSVRDRDIKAEIRSLEAQQKALERKENKLREGDYEVVENREKEKSAFVRVEKDKRGRLALVRPHQ